MLARNADERWRKTWSVVRRLQLEIALGAAGAKLQGETERILCANESDLELTPADAGRRREPLCARSGLCFAAIRRVGDQPLPLIERFMRAKINSEGGEPDQPRLPDSSIQTTVSFGAGV